MPVDEHIKLIIENLYSGSKLPQSMINTPNRAAKALEYMTHGYKIDPEKVISQALFDSNYSDMVLVKDIDFYSLCEHHLLPFFGNAHIAYLPNKKIIGLSKIARIVEVFSRRFQTQENLTNEIAEAIYKFSNCLGVAIKIEAQHLCMMIRGVEKPNSRTITSLMLGKFKESALDRESFYNAL